MVSTLSLRAIEDCAVTVPVTTRLLEVLKVAQRLPLVLTVTSPLLAVLTFVLPLLIVAESTERVVHCTPEPVDWRYCPAEPTPPPAVRVPVRVPPEIVLLVSVCTPSVVTAAPDPPPPNGTPRT